MLIYLLHCSIILYRVILGHIVLYQVMLSDIELHLHFHSTNRGHQVKICMNMYSGRLDTIVIIQILIHPHILFTHPSSSSSSSYPCVVARKRHAIFKIKQVVTKKNRVKEQLMSLKKRLKKLRVNSCVIIPLRCYSSAGKYLLESLFYICPIIRLSSIAPV